MRYLSVCSGIEAATVAWHPFGWTPVAFSEIEPFPAAVLAHHYPDVPNYGDMTKHKEWPLGPGSIDLLVGGTPCQSFSVAGLRKGISDPRGGLMLTYLEIAQRLRPRWIVWENVPGVLSSGGGRDFGSFLGALVELGYGVAYRVLDAQWVRTQRHPRAVPQRRRRVFVVGCLGDWERAAAVLFERESVQRDSASSRASRKAAPSDAEARIARCVTTGEGKRQDYETCTIIPQPVPYDLFQITAPVNRQNRQPGDPCHTLARDNAAHAAVVNMQGSKSNACVSTDGSSFTLNAMHGHDVHAVVVGTDLYNGAITGDVAATMGTPGSSVNASGPTVMAFAQNQLGEVRTSDVSGTINTNSNASGRNTPMAAVAFPIDTQNMTEGHASGGLGFGQHGDPSFTVTKGHSHAVAHAFYSTGGTHGVNQHPEVSPAVKVGSGLGIPSPPAVAFTRCDNGRDASVEVTPTMRCGSNYSAHPAVACPTLTAHNDPSRSPQSSEVTQQVAAVHAASMTVRRLTPRECERLQAFPDDYTLIPWRKKPAADCPDGPRYKALGNSMAVNCMAWIGERIAAVEARHD